MQGGSFGQFIAEATGTVSLKESSHIVHFSKNFSEGYRYNTDFDNTNYVLKSQFNKNKVLFQILWQYISSFKSESIFTGFNKWYYQSTTT